MKKIISIALVLLLAAGFCFANEERKVIITGTIEDGDTETPDGVNDPGDVVVDGPIKIVARIITSKNNDGVAPDGESWPEDGVPFTNSQTSFTADLTHELPKEGSVDDASIDSFTVVYGAYGNVSAANAANYVTIKTSDSGWMLGGEKADGQMKLNVDNSPYGSDSDIMYGTTGDNSGDIKVVTKGGDTAGTLYIVGYTKVTWSKADSVSTPTAGSYSATITFTFDAS